MEIRRLLARHRRIALDTCVFIYQMERNPRYFAVADAVFDQHRMRTDGEGAIYDRQQAFQQARFNTVALPLYAIVDADGRTVASLAGLTRDPAAFVAFLREGSSGN